MYNVKFTESFRFKLTAMIVSMILIPLLIFSFVFLDFVKNIVSKKYSDSAIQSVYESSRNIDFRLDSLQEFSNIILTNRDFIGLLSTINKAAEPIAFENLLRSFLTSREDVEGIYAYSGDQSYWVGSNKVLKFDHNSKWYQDLVKSEGEVQWINTRNEKIKIMAGDFEKYYFSLGRKLVDLYTLKELGIMVVDVDEGILEKSYKNLVSEGEVFLCDKEGRIISHPDKRKIGTDLGNEPYIRNILSSNTDFGKLPYDATHNESIVIYSTCKTTGWKLVKIIPSHYLYSEIEKMNSVMRVAGGIYVIVTLCLAMLFSVMSTKPIIHMMKKMKEVENGNLDISIDVKRKDEIGQLGMSFNNMIYDIRFLINKLVEEERIKKEIELESLHAQINPHFLYNTLNTIKWMAKMQGAKNISSTITALIKLLRISINLSNEKIALEDEIEYVKNYVLIQKIRFNEQFEISYSLSEDCIKCSIPKLILQPIVENAIIYGSREDGTRLLNIDISAHREGNNLVIQVADNGPGIEEQVLKRIFKSEKNVNKFSVVGLNNVNERIKNYFGEEYGVGISTEVGKGTIVKINLPYIVEGGGNPNVQSDDR